MEEHAALGSNLGDGLGLNDAVGVGPHKSDLEAFALELLGASEDRAMFDGRDDQMPATVGIGAGDAFRARLSDQVAPLVKMTSLGSQPKALAISSRQLATRPAAACP